MTKAELRKIYKERRSQLSAEQRRGLSAKICANVIAAFGFEHGSCVHVFMPIEFQREVDTLLLIKHFWENGVRVFVPKVVPDDIESVEITPDTQFIKNKWGIPEPEISSPSVINHFDYVFTPLLYCDSAGNRVGYGKGFYDRFFSRINADVVKVGLNFFQPKESIEDVFSDDIPLDYLVTPRDVLSFGRA